MLDIYTPQQIPLKCGISGIEVTISTVDCIISPFMFDMMQIHSHSTFYFLFLLYVLDQKRLNSTYTIANVAVVLSASVCRWLMKLLQCYYMTSCELNC